MSHALPMAKFIGLAMTLAIAGCGGSSPQQKIVHNASSHWSCPAEQIRVDKLDGETYRAAGCDHEAAYSCRNSSDCTRVSGF